jgi:DNA (cytosine-5)-methyltransferase 1
MCENPSKSSMQGAGWMDPEKTFCEFFAGIGLVGEGLRSSGWACLYANDVNAQKKQLYEARNGASAYYHLEDVNNTAEIVARIPGRPALATASFPCVDLSLAGHYRGLEGRESSTFFAFARVLTALEGRRPPLVLLENVPGFLTSRQGQDFVTAAETLAALGYRLDAFVLDARHFTPQSRRRVFVIGAGPEVPPPAARPTPPASLLRPFNLVRVLSTLQLPTGWLNLALPDPPECALRLENAIDLDETQTWWEQPEVDRHYRMMSDDHRLQVNALRHSLFTRVGTAYRRVRRDGQRTEVRFDGLAGCLRTPRGGSGKQIVIAVGEGRLRMRWMSPREYARLQGAPDFPLVGGRNQQLFGFGDAVCVPVVGWVDRHVLTPLYERARAEQRNGHAGQSKS